MRKDPPLVDCPTCGQKARFEPANPWRPFCSEHCKSIDLGAWASERFRIAAEWARADIDAVMDLIMSGKLSLEGLVTNHAKPDEAPDAYRTAFTDPTCLKMILDWRDAA